MAEFFAVDEEARGWLEREVVPVVCGTGGKGKGTEGGKRVGGRVSVVSLDDSSCDEQ